MNFRQTLTRSLRRNFLIVAGLMCVLAFGVVTQDKESVSRPLPTGAPALVLSECVPANGGHIGAVVIQRPNSGAEMVTAKRFINKAVGEEVYGTDWENVRVLGFCK